MNLLIVLLTTASVVALPRVKRDSNVSSTTDKATTTPATTTASTTDATTTSTQGSRTTTAPHWPQPCFGPWPCMRDPHFPGGPFPPYGPAGPHPGPWAPPFSPVGPFGPAPGPMGPWARRGGFGGPRGRPWGKPWGRPWW